MKNGNQVVPAPVSATEILRHQLTLRIRHRPLNRIVEDINDEIAAKANRETAWTIASRMSDDANVANAIARTLIGGFTSEVNREARDITEAMLQTFLDGGDLGDVAKARLAEYVSEGFKTYDAEHDRLKPTRTEVPQTISAFPPRWVHPDPRVREAQATYHAALKAARR
jgi:hypothetical protein